MPQDLLRDIKGPVFFKADYTLLIVLAAAVLITALIFLGIFFYKKFKQNRSTDKKLPKKPAHEIAYEALQNLKDRNLPAFGTVKQYYSELSDIIRVYIENRFNINAPEMTTEEFLYTLKDSSELLTSHKNLLKEFMTLSDIVKFAKYGPSDEEINNSFDAAKKFVDETKEISKK